MSESESTTPSKPPRVRDKAKEAASNKAWREANKERLAAYNAKYRARKTAYVMAWRQADPSHNLQQKAYRDANKAKTAARAKAWYEANKSEIRAKQKAFRDANAEKEKARVLRKSYGLSYEQYQQMLRQCHERCEICKTAFAKDVSRRVNVDHCHKTGRIRGLICHKCNIALGHANDDVKLLQLMIRYLKRFKE